MLKKYTSEIFKIIQKGDAREESFYRALASLVESFAQSISKAKTEITIQPAKTEAGNPDFRVWDGK